VTEVFLLLGVLLKLGIYIFHRNYSVRRWHKYI